MKKHRFQVTFTESDELGMYIEAWNAGGRIPPLDPDPSEWEIEQLLTAAEEEMIDLEVTDYEVWNA